MASLVGHYCIISPRPRFDNGREESVEEGEGGGPPPPPPLARRLGVVVPAPRSDGACKLDAAISA